MSTFKHSKSGFIKALVLTTFFVTPSATAWAEEPSENPANMSQIGATTYFESLGWDYSTGTWTNGAPVDTELGGGATVAIMDGRANDTHSELPYNADPNADPLTESVVFEFTGFPFSPTYSGPDVHGSHTSGIVAAKLNGIGTSGVAPKARLLNYAMFDDNGWVGADEDAVLTQAVSYGATVANMSYGPGATGDFASASSLSAINNHKNSIVVVKSAGNTGAPLLNEVMKGKDRTPLTNLIIVGSTDMTGSIAWYSNTPGSACIVIKNSCGVALKDIFMVAPGGSAHINADGTAILGDDDGFTDGIWSTDETGGYYRMSGTSMAAPHVAGAVALLHSRWQILKTDPLTTRNILFDTADDLGDPGVDDVYGHGMLNVAAAMAPVGDPTFGLGGGDGGSGGDGGGGGGGKGKGGGKPAKSWALAETGMRTGGGFAALSETKTSISVFDKYRRDFPVALSDLVHEGRSDLSERLEQMIGSRASADPDFYIPGRDDLLHAVTLDHQSLQGKSPRNIMTDLKVTALSDFDMRLFAGSGNALPLFYSPAVVVGGMSTLAGGSSGINPFLGFAAGDLFSGASIDRVGPFRFAVGYSENDDNEVRFDDYKAGATAASVTFAVSDAQTINVAITDLRERGGVFGSRSQGALSFGETSRTRALTLSWDHASWKGIALTASYTMGVSQGSSNGLLTLGDDTLSEAFHFGLAKSGLVSDADHFVLSLSQPVRVASGSLQLYADRAYDINAVMQMQSETISLTPSGRELDVQVEYRLALASLGHIGAFAYHAMDAGHIAGRQESGMGVKYQLRF